MKLIMLGTGHAMVTKCYNTCFALQNDAGFVLTDAGGGNGILAMAAKAGLRWNDLRAMIITHAHTDHILGGIWVLRQINSMIAKGAYTGELQVYGLADCVDFLRNAGHSLLSEKLCDDIHFIPCHDGSAIEEIGIKFTLFNIHSTKKPQMGYKTVFDNDITLTCLGDEPCKPQCYKYAANVDWLMCEAFCLRSQAEIFHPYEKSHSTALDAGKLAASLHVKNLILYHTEDANLPTRKQAYTEEARAHFHGNIYAPDDLETIELD